MVRVVHLQVLFGSDFGDIVGLVWAQFSWIFVGHLWVLFWQWWMVGDGQ